MHGNKYSIWRHSTIRESRCFWIDLKCSSAFLISNFSICTYREKGQDCKDDDKRSLVVQHFTLVERFQVTQEQPRARVHKLGTVLEYVILMGVFARVL